MAALRPRETSCEAQDPRLFSFPPGQRRRRDMLDTGAPGLPGLSYLSVFLPVVVFWVVFVYFAIHGISSVIASSVKYDSKIFFSKKCFGFFCFLFFSFSLSGFLSQLSGAFSNGGETENKNKAKVYFI